MFLEMHSLMKQHGTRTVSPQHFSSIAIRNFLKHLSIVTVNKCLKTVYSTKSFLGEDKNVAEDFEMQNFASLLCDDVEGMKV